jgi:hypothetical protein
MPITEFLVRDPPAAAVIAGQLKTGRHLLAMSSSHFEPEAVIGRTEISQRSSLLPAAMPVVEFRPRSKRPGEQRLRPAESPGESRPGR